ncbi:TPA: hypothetical protein DDY33_00630, partial [Candidatus Nomurabacteria bacterium]|nr:hypothetical protein [Candidatus Nomurabacteria bacterium]HCT85509.1 hypothetical protein [Candidatus Margulisiibacteriota bacterium]
NSVNTTTLNCRTICPICNDKGIYLVTSGETPTFQKCSCMEQKRIDRIMRNSRITSEFQKMRVNNYNTFGKSESVVQAKKITVNYITNFDSIKHNRDNSVSFLGQPGVGKTHLCCAIANALMTKGIPVLYFPHREGFSELLASLRRRDQDYFEISRESDTASKIQAMKEIDVLVWDDLFKSKKVTNFEYNTVFEVINYRYMNFLPTVISSEYLPVDLLRFDEAIGRRIIESSKGHLVEFMKNPEMIHGLT